MNVYQDKSVFITGAASGIGRCLALELGSLGAKLYLTDINQASLEETVDLVKAQGGSAWGQVLDVTDYAAFNSQVQDAAQRYGSLDYIFNNAGIAIAAEMRYMEPDHWRKVIDVNLHGVFNGSHAAYQIMVGQGWGHIVNLSSIEGMIPFPTTASYVASKYAVLGMSQTMWVEGASLGIKVSAVCPGFIKTPLFDTSAMINIDRQKIMDQYGTLQKLGVTAEKCAQVILKGVAKGKPIIPVTGAAHVIWRLARLAPIGLMKYIQKDFDKWRNVVRSAG